VNVVARFLRCSILAFGCLLDVFHGDKLPAQNLPAPFYGLVDFVKDVQPLLRDHCWSCHGTEKQESGLRLDRRDLALQGGDLGKIVVRGKSESSQLIHFVAGADPDKVMPPEGDRLTDSQIGILRAWIDQGCTWPDSPAAASELNRHWVYQPLA